MGTKTIGIRDDVYKRLKFRKRDDESFTDLVDRILDETRADWQEGFGTLDEEEAEKLERAVEASREQRSAGLTARQRAAFEALSLCSERSGTVTQVLISVAGDADGLERVVGVRIESGYVDEVRSVVRSATERLLR